MSPELALPAETYRTIYRGSTVVLGIGSDVPDATAAEIAQHVTWMREGNIGVRVYTVHRATHHRLQGLLAPEILAPESFHHSKDEVPEMIRRITASEMGNIGEIIVLSEHRGIRTTSGAQDRVLPLVAQTKFNALIDKHGELEELLSAVDGALSLTPRVVLTGPESLGDEIRNINGKGTTCFDPGAMNYGPLFAYELPIFERILRRGSQNGTCGQATKERTRARNSHFVMRTGGMPVAGLSMIERGAGRISADHLWGYSEAGNLGPFLLQRITEQADSACCSCSVMTTRIRLARLLGSHPGMQDLGTISSLKENGQIEMYAPEYKEYDTRHGDPRVFWYEGKR